MRKTTTDAMHLGLGRAVVDLRARLHWGQEDLADAMHKQDKTLTPDRITVSRWERGEHAPSETHRLALARIAAKHEYDDLVELFRAPISAWRLVGHMKLGSKAE